MDQSQQSESYIHDTTVDGGADETYAEAGETYEKPAARQSRAGSSSHGIEDQHPAGGSPRRCSRSYSIVDEVFPIKDSEFGKFLGF
jgi:hypothetical protein